MATAHATPFAVQSQTFRLHFKIVSAVTGNPLTGGLTGLVAQVSRDASAFVSSANTPTEIGTSGYGFLDLSAAEMIANAVVVRIAATNSNAVEFSREVVPVSLASFAGRFDVQAVQRPEQLWLDLHALLGGNGVTQSGAALTYSNPDGSPKMTCSVTQTETTGAKSKPM